MQKTKIDWADYTINPVKGLCPMDCKDNQGKSYCYARRMYKRFKWNPEISYDVGWFHALYKIPPHSKVFVGSTMELFGSWIPKGRRRQIIGYSRAFPELTFIFLTKQPQNLPREFPDNCWVGVGVCNDKMLDVAVDKLEDIQAEIKFISFEPLLEKLTLSLDYAFYYSGISWVILGAETPYSLKTAPKLEWVREIVEAADRANIPVFLKKNLKPVLRNSDGWTSAWAVNARGCDGTEYLRQEFPI